MTDHADTFPVATFGEAAQHLRRPFTPQAVKFKVQATWPKGAPTGGLVVAYIDARLVVERLNLIIPDRWSDHYEPVAGGLLCHLTVDGVTRTDIGEGQVKGLYSDALKRAAVKFGVGVSLYAIPKMILNVSAGHAKAKGQGDRATLEMTDAGEKFVRERYRTWLESAGIRAFGKPLDHGDVDDAAGDPEDPAVPGVEPASQPAAAPTQSGPRLASEKQRNLIRVRASDSGTGPLDLANAILIASGKSGRDFESLDAAEVWVSKALERLPAGLVNPVLESISALSEGPVPT